MLALDTEFTFRDATLVALAFSLDGRTAYAVKAADTWPLDPTRTLVLHNARADVPVLQRAGLLPGGVYPPVYDTMLLAALLGLERIGLKVLDERFFGGQQHDRLFKLIEEVDIERHRTYYGALAAETLRALEASPPNGRKVRKLDLKVVESLRAVAEAPVPQVALARRHGLREQFGVPAPVDVDDVPWDRLKVYVGHDAALTMRLYEKLQTLAGWDAALRVYRDIEEPLMPVLDAVERRGIHVSRRRLDEAEEQFSVRVEDIRMSLGVNEDWLTPDALGQLLYGEWGLPVTRYTDKTHQPSTDRYALEEAAHYDPRANLILEAKGLMKLLSTYIPLRDHLDANSRLHGRFNQLRADPRDEESGGIAVYTGRLSSSDPNLQNIPIRTDEGRVIRRAFTATPGGVFVKADYGQIELRTMATLADEGNLIDALRRGEDIHAFTASRIYKVALSDVTVTQRRNAKQVNFGLPFGMQSHGLAFRLDIPETEGAAILEMYFERFPRVHDYFERCIAHAREHGYVETLLGRRVYIPQIHSSDGATRAFAERTAHMAPIQGSAADIIKLAVPRLECALKAHEPWGLVNIVHDECDVDWPTFSDELQCIVVKSMVEEVEPLAKLAVPLILDVKHAESWGDIE